MREVVTQAPPLFYGSGKKPGSTYPLPRLAVSLMAQWHYAFRRKGTLTVGTPQLEVVPAIEAGTSREDGGSPPRATTRQRPGAKRPQRVGPALHQTWSCSGEHKNEVTNATRGLRLDWGFCGGVVFLLQNRHAQDGSFVGGRKCFVCRWGNTSRDALDLTLNQQGPLRQQSVPGFRLLHLPFKGQIYARSLGRGSCAATLKVVTTRRSKKTSRQARMRQPEQPNSAREGELPDALSCPLLTTVFALVRRQGTLEPHLPASGVGTLHLTTG